MSEQVKRWPMWRAIEELGPDDWVVRDTCYDALAQRCRELEAELETERMRLAACGVVAMANTPDSAAKARDMHPEYYSSSCYEVARAVDREMSHRTELERCKAWQAVPEGWGVDTVDNVLSTIRFVLGVKSGGGTPSEQLRQMIDEVASWGASGPCTPRHDQMKEAASARAMYAAAPPAAEKPSMAMREELGGTKAVSAMLTSALKSLAFHARTTGGTAGPDAKLMEACEQAEHALSLGGIGRAYMQGADAAIARDEQPGHSCGAADMVRCYCGDAYPADSYDAGFIHGSGMCQNCDAAIPAKDIAPPAADLKARLEDQA